MRNLLPVPPGTNDNRVTTPEERERKRQERAEWHAEVKRILKRRGRRTTPEPTDIVADDDVEYRNEQKRKAPFPTVSLVTAETPPRRPRASADDAGWRSYQPVSAGSARPERTSKQYRVRPVARKRG